MKRHARIIPLCLVALLLSGGELWAWSPAAHRLICEKALEGLPQAQRRNVTRWEAVIIEGSKASHQDLSADLTGDFENLPSAVAAEMNLLAKVSGKRFSPYVGYRMGVLGALVAEACYPFPFYDERDPKSGAGSLLEKDINEHLRELVQGNIRQGKFLTDPKGRVEHALDAARESRYYIDNDYHVGTGYGGHARRAMKFHFDYAVKAVADVWFTFLLSGGNPIVGTVSSASIMRFRLAEIDFYLERRMDDDAELSLNSLSSMDPELQEHLEMLGDFFLASGNRSKALEAFSQAWLLAPDSPTLRQKIELCSGQEFSDRFSVRDIGRRRATGDRTPKGNSSELLTGVQDLSARFLAERGLYRPSLRPVKTTTNERGETNSDERESRADDLNDIIYACSRTYDIPSSLVKAVIQAESDFDPYAVSEAGARGLMQLMPYTAIEMGVNDVFDPAQNVEGGVQYLAKMLDLFGGDLRLGLAAYNAGPGAVKKYGGVPPYKETRTYIRRVSKYYAMHRANDEKVDLKVREGSRPAPDYLPKPATVSGASVIYLTNGNTMRGKQIVKTKTGVRVMLRGSWVLVPHGMISKIADA